MHNMINEYGNVISPKSTITKGGKKMKSLRPFVICLVLSFFFYGGAGYTQETTAEQAQKVADEAKADADKRRQEALGKGQKDPTPEAHKGRIKIN